MGRDRGARTMSEGRRGHRRTRRAGIAALVGTADACWQPAAVARTTTTAPPRRPSRRHLRCTFTKAFDAAAINPGGVSTLTFTITT